MSVLTRFSVFDFPNPDAEVNDVRGTEEVVAAHVLFIWVFKIPFSPSACKFTTNQDPYLKLS